MKRGSLRKFRPDGHQGDGSGLRAVSKDIMKETIKGGITGFKRNSLFEKDHTMRLGVSNRGFKSRLKKKIGEWIENNWTTQGMFWCTINCVGPVYSHATVHYWNHIHWLSSRCTESFCGFQSQLSRNELELFNENGENLTKTADNAVTMTASINRFSPSIFKQINMRLNMNFN